MSLTHHQLIYLLYYSLCIVQYYLLHCVASTKGIIRLSPTERASKKKLPPPDEVKEVLIGILFYLVMPTFVG
jgi:hypothetical protein